MSTLRSPNLRPLGAGRVVDEAIAALREAILSGEIAPGEPLSVPALSARFGVSRSPVREAVLAMAAEGLAVDRPRRGVVAVDVGPNEADAIHEVREPLEGLAARLAARRIEGRTLRALEMILTEQEAAVDERDEAGFFRTNTEFHALIARASGNAELPRLLGSLEGRMALALRRVASRPGHRKAALAEHRKVLKALAAGDRDEAESAMRRHLAATRKRAAD